MTHDDFWKKYNVMPAQPTWLGRELLGDKLREVMSGIFIVDGIRYCGILLKAFDSDSWKHDDDLWYFFKTIPYWDDKNNVIEYDIIDHPYHSGEYNFIEEDLTRDAFADFLMSELKKYDPDGYDVLSKKIQADTNE